MIFRDKGDDMTKSGKRIGSSLLAATGVLLIAASAAAIAQRVGAHAGGGAHQHFDGRFSHDQYYYDRGYAIRRPPVGGLGELRGPDGGRYWLNGGNWYRWRGGAWVVSAAPVGLFVPWLPPNFTTVWWNGIPYYYANETYYVWDDAQHEYEVVDPPAGIDTTGTTQTPASDQIFVYPNNGQSSEQLAKDRYECYRWAADQTGFDPTVAGGGVAPQNAVAKRNDFFRAQVSCLAGRGYSVT
jgi:hypothetical protein